MKFQFQQWLSPYGNGTLRVWSRPRLVARLNTSTNKEQRFRFSSQHNESEPANNSRYHPLEVLTDANATVDHFRDKYFHPELPVLFPRRHFRHLPAFERWFQASSSSSNHHASRLNTAYLQEHGADAFVPLELTQLSTPQDASETNSPTFQRFHAPLSLFLQWMNTTETQAQTTRLYLAQCQLLDLPQVLRDDFPIPDIVSQAGKGDIYDTNVWIGHAPTYTPLHRDPNPNLFVQLAGHKVVRLLDPNAGQKVFASVRRELGKSGDRAAAAIRGEEMMLGRERVLLEKAVWDDTGLGNDMGTVRDIGGYEAHLEAGDGLFIPKGWWHSIKGIGEGVTASVNWWFR